MLNKLNSFLRTIIFEDLYDNNILNDDILYENQTIAIIPGSFKPPHKGHWEMVMKFVNKDDVNKVIVLISNISTKAISARPLSLSNLKKFLTIKSFIEDNNLMDEKIKEGLKIIDSMIDNLSFSILNDIISNKFIKSCEEQCHNNKKFLELKVMLISYLDDLNKNLFKSIRKAGDFEITPEVSKKIFEIYSEKYNVGDIVDIEISKSASPITDTINFINYNIKNCKVLLGVSEKGNDQSRWNGIDKSIKNETVEIIPFPVSVDTMLSASDIRNDITNINKDQFPDKLNNDDFNKIKNLLK